MGKSKKYYWYLSLIYALPLFVMAILVICGYATSPAEMLRSDYPQHIRFAEYFQHMDIFDYEGKEFVHIFSYPLFHITTALLGFVLGDLQISAAVVSAVSLAATVLLLRRIVRELIPDRSVIQNYAIDFFCVTSVFMAGICGFVTNNKFYLPLGSLNVWHNPTYIFMRPFAIAALYLFVRYYKDCFGSAELRDGGRDGAAARHGAAFAVVLLLSVLAKPNFALFFLLAAGLLVAVSVMKSIGRGGIRGGLRMLLCVLPSLLLMLWQKWFCEQFSVVRFELELLPLDEIISKQNLRGLISHFLPTVLFFAARGHKLVFRDTLYTLILMMLAATSFVWYCTVQGIVAYTDYAWSYFFAVYLSTLTAAGYSLAYVKNRLYWAGFSAVWLLQLGYGMAYMINILNQRSYLI